MHKKRDTRGMSLEDLSDYGIVSSTILARLRDTHNIGRTIQNLKLFGPEADISIKPEDPPIVQVFKEHAKLYAKASEDGLLKVQTEILEHMTKLTLGWSAREEAVLTHAVKIQIEAARMQLRKQGGNEFTEAELIAQAEKVIS
jgi:hypothetical protein